MKPFQLTPGDTIQRFDEFRLRDGGAWVPYLKVWGCTITELMDSLYEFQRPQNP